MAEHAALIFGPLAGEDTGLSDVSAVCLGTGRFLRAVLVPGFVELGERVILAQARGRSFGEYMMTRTDNSYEVDTVLRDGKVVTARYALAATGSLGISEGRDAFMRLPANLPALRYIGLGLTEAGIVHNGPSIQHLAEFLHACFVAGRGHDQPLSVINTDNMPFNGDAIFRHVCCCDYTQGVHDHEAFERWLEQSVCFHNSMVDRITSHREGQPDIPRAEPLPAKALVIEDLLGVLPASFGSVPGVVVRTHAKQLDLDINLKLRIANGLHTAMVYAMALGGLRQTDCCIGHPDILPYLEQLFERDIVNVCGELSVPRLQVTPVFSEWMARLQHPHFGLSCFFVCQNASQKMGIRLLPSVNAALVSGREPSDFMVFALAVILRFLTPSGDQPRLGAQPPVFRGRLDPSPGDMAGEDSWEYTSGLHVYPESGIYEFCDGDGIAPMLLRTLGRFGGCSAAAATSVASDVLSRLEGFDPRGTPAHQRLAARTGQMLMRMLGGESALAVLATLKPQQPLYLDAQHLAEAVQQEVDAAEAIDVHTHLFSAEHGKEKMKYGIDELLTYHYLVSQYISMSGEDAGEFYKLPQREQAERVWERLFVEASPLSEPCRGVLTTLHALGLHDALADRDLNAIRKWYEGQDADMFNEKMMRLARLRYIVTTHDPFDSSETQECLSPPPEPPRYRSALSVDKLFQGDWASVRKGLELAGEPATLRGIAACLQRCVKSLRPVFVTALTSHDFLYGEPCSIDNDQVDAHLDKPIADGSTPTSQQVLDYVLLPLCKRTGLPLSLRMGIQCAVCPALGLAGDGMAPAPLDSLARLCRLHPKVKFLATVLRHADQHEVAVLSGKFRNLHLWGCWWYCNNPTLVAQVTALRLEMLGTSFTFQTSSARVHDQLIYKWIHARALLVRVLRTKYDELLQTGWRVSRGDIRRDVHRLLGGAYEEFMAQSL